MPAVTADQVHLYQVDLAQPATAVQALERLLSADEVARADRFAFAHLRRRYIAGRGQLRRLLGGYLQMPPEQVAFAYGPSGKPLLATPDAAPPLTFNIAHSTEIALMAFGRGRRVGVDVEQVRAMSDLPAIAQRFFSASEQSALFALAACDQADAFFRIWTRKEAFLKATGEGLSRPLDSFSVSLALDTPRLVEHQTAADTAVRWTLVHLAPLSGFCGALAVEGDGWTLRQRPFSL